MNTYPFIADAHCILDNFERLVKCGLLTIDGYSLIGTRYSKARFVVATFTFSSIFIIIIMTCQPTFKLLRWQVINRLMDGCYGDFFTVRYFLPLQPTYLVVEYTLMNHVFLIHHNCTFCMRLRLSKPLVSLFILLNHFLLMLSINFGPLAD